MRVTSQPPIIEIRYPEATGRPSLSLQLGQTFSALARITADGLLLEMGRYRLPARADVVVQDGDRLTLRVTELAPRLTLKVLDHRGPRPAIDAALREALPRQTQAAHWNTVVQSLGQAGTAELPPAVREGLRQLLAHLPTTEPLQRPDGLRTALYESGPFLEARLAAATPHTAAAVVQSDTKALLLRLATRLRSLPPPPHLRPRADRNADLGSAGRPARPGPAGAPAPTPTGMPAPSATATPTPILEPLLRQTEGMVARLQALQARAAAEPGTLDLGFELPIRDGSDLQALRLRIRDSGTDRSSGTEDDGRQLTVDLQFQLTRAGTIQTRVRLQGKAVSTAWYAEQRDTAEAIARALPELERRLETAGLAVGALTCAHGLAYPEDADRADTLRHRGLLHEQA